jgi:hypothetical protein
VGQIGSVGKSRFLFFFFSFFLFLLRLERDAEISSIEIRSELLAAVEKPGEAVF